MQQVINFLVKNDIEYTKDSKGIAYEGFYYWFFISNLRLETTDINLLKKEIKNNINH